MDAFGHVNNVQFLRLIEDARVQLIYHHPDTPADHLMRYPRVVAHQQIDYLAPLSFRSAPVPIDVWVSTVGGASYDMCYEVLDDDGERPVVYARALTTMVHVDPKTGRPQRLTESERQEMSSWLDEPIPLRSRGPAK